MVLYYCLDIGAQYVVPYSKKSSQLDSFNANYSFFSIILPDLNSETDILTSR
jgi:hypothetical protein